MSAILEEVLRGRLAVNRRYDRWYYHLPFAWLYYGFVVLRHHCMGRHSGPPAP